MIGGKTVKGKIQRKEYLNGFIAGVNRGHNLIYMIARDIIDRFREMKNMEIEKLKKELRLK